MLVSSSKKKNHKHTNSIKESKWMGVKLDKNKRILGSFSDKLI